jgi:hypothetical protein
MRIRQSTLALSKEGGSWEVGHRVRMENATFKSFPF